MRLRLCGFFFRSDKLVQFCKCYFQFEDSLLRIFVRRRKTDAYRLRLGVYR